MARSLVENDQPPKPRVNHKAAQSQFFREALRPDFTISDFIWRCSTPDPQIDDVFATLKSCDPQTFTELVAGFD